MQSTMFELDECEVEMAEDMLGDGKRPDGAEEIGAEGHIALTVEGGAAECLDAPSDVDAADACEDGAAAAECAQEGGSDAPVPGESAPGDSVIDEDSGAFQVEHAGTDWVDFSEGRTDDGSAEGPARRRRALVAAGAAVAVVAALGLGVAWASGTFSGGEAPVPAVQSAVQSAKNAVSKEKSVTVSLAAEGWKEGDGSFGYAVVNTDGETSAEGDAVPGGGLRPQARRGRLRDVADLDPDVVRRLDDLARAPGGPVHRLRNRR